MLRGLWLPRPGVEAGGIGCGAAAIDTVTDAAPGGVTISRALPAVIDEPSLCCGARDCESARVEANNDTFGAGCGCDAGGDAVLCDGHAAGEPAVAASAVCRPSLPFSSPHHLTTRDAVGASPAAQAAHAWNLLAELGFIAMKFR